MRNSFVGPRSPHQENGSIDENNKSIAMIEIKTLVKVMVVYCQENQSKNIENVNSQYA